MLAQPSVLLLGATGRTGSRVLRQLLERGWSVRVIVRSLDKLPATVTNQAGLTRIEGDLLALSDEDLRRQVHGCAAVISCLGHVLTVRGIFGRPRDLVTEATLRLCSAIEALQPSEPVKFVLMSSVSVHRARALDPHRGLLERAFLALIRWLLPPARDNQRATDFLLEKVGTSHPFIEWVAVRPDSLQEGDVSAYALHEGITHSLFAPGTTNMANVAHFMCELVSENAAWDQWKCKLPVITNVR